MGAIVPRWYQRDAAIAVVDDLKRFSSVLVVLPTGTGKTVLFSQLAAALPGRILVIAHRAELLLQALGKLQAATGERVGFEQAGIVSHGERIVVASAQSIWKGERLERLAQEGFDYIIVDEVHHYVAKSYKRLLQAFWGQLIGVTATPKRHDKKQLRTIFQHVSYRMDLLDAQELGLVVPFEPERIMVKQIDISEVATVAGDLQKAQLDRAMVRACAGIAHQIAERYSGRRGFVYMPGKTSAELISQLLNNLIPGSAICVTESTPKEERAELRQRMNNLECRYVCNAMLFTEGVDWPAADFIAPCRYTKSTPLFLQMLGRGGRPLDGVLDGLTEESQTPERLAAIAASAKPACKVADFVGNFGKHSPVTLEDALGESVEEPVRQKARLMLRSTPNATSRDISAAYKRASADVARIKAEAKQITVTKVEAVAVPINWRDPRQALKIRPNPFADRAPPTPKQVETLERMGFDAAGLTRAEAGRAFAMLAERREKGLSSIPQLRRLSEYIEPPRGLKFEKATAGLNYIRQKGWSKSQVDPDVLKRLLLGR